MNLTEAVEAIVLKQNISPPPGYRILEFGEIIEIDDLIWSSDSRSPKSWRPTPIYGTEVLLGMSFARAIQYP